MGAASVNDKAKEERPVNLDRIFYLHEENKRRLEKRAKELAEKEQQEREQIEQTVDKLRYRPGRYQNVKSQYMRIIEPSPKANSSGGDRWPFAVASPKTQTKEPIAQTHEANKAASSIHEGEIKGLLKETGTNGM